MCFTYSASLFHTNATEDRFARKGGGNRRTRLIAKPRVVWLLQKAGVARSLEIHAPVGVLRKELPFLITLEESSALCETAAFINHT